MPKFIMEDDCLTPEPRIRIDFKGPNPFRFYPEMKRMLIDLLEIRSKDIWERDFRWDFLGDPRKFFVRIVARKKYDAWTYSIFEFLFQGSHPTDPTKDGELVIFIWPKLQTVMPHDTVWQRSAIYKGMRWLYFKTFYNNARRVLLGKCIHHTENLVTRFQTLLNILPERKA